MSTVPGARNRVTTITRARVDCGLRQARLARGWSQEQLERIAGVKQTQISAIENGRETPSPGAGAWRRLSAALGVLLVEGIEVAPTWFRFLQTEFADELTDQELAALVDIAANPRWRDAPLQTWVSLIVVVRTVL